MGITGGKCADRRNNEMAHINMKDVATPKREIGIWVYGCGEEAIVKTVVQVAGVPHYLPAVRTDKDELVTQMREVLYDLGWTCIEHKVVE